MRRRCLGLILIAFLMTACGGGPTPFPTVGVTVQAFPHVEIRQSTATPVTPTLTAVPTDTPSSTDTPIPTDTVAPTLTATALIQLAPPTATTGFVQPTQFRPTRTPVPSATVPPPTGPLTFHNVSFVGAQPDPSRPPDGALTTLSLEFAGGRPPYNVTHDGVLVVSNSNGDGQFENAGVKYTYIHFTIPRTCGGHVFGTVILQSGDGQTFTNGYWVDDAPCS